MKICAISIVFEKPTRAGFFQIALETILLTILISNNKEAPQFKLVFAATEKYTHRWGRSLIIRTLIYS